ncbi:MULTISPECIES: diguanylate cyclase [unclassified Mesorhizobium]|uniref:sensor domain-containing diguanylate cyclase n=3 Tax=Mesorhizobium TaxID=68287 RepID=UPI000FC9FA74|nr:MULTISPECIES: diguanylate cyclase [unclassified Mesorhizobium]RUT89273.1 diguanylate cyclase [Mesorhizobium sp. M7A.T.Ca.US.000.02.1.1]RUT94156.1 diguanylate cyclase [Mesorhizobium sp. M7A.T.Ca.US.000.02.2.1]
MRIKSQIILSMVAAAALIALVGGVAIFTQKVATKSLGLTEATNVARELADTIVFKSTDGTLSLLDRPEALKQFLLHQHRRLHRDFLVLDSNKTILAHAADEEHQVGDKFGHDPGNEIGQTLADGIPRRFVDPEEVNAILAVPIENPEGAIIGAVLLEYDPVLQAAEQSTDSLLWLVGLSTAAAVLVAVGFAWQLLRRVSSGLGDMMRGMEALAKGNAMTRISHARNDEFGQLADGFNTMADQLASARAHVEDIVETAAEGIAVLDGDGRIASANPAAATMIGRRADKIVGQQWDSVLTIRDPRGGAFAAGASPIEMALATGRQQQGEVRLARSDGSHLPVIASCGPLSRSEGGLVLTLNDISELRRAEGVVNERADQLALLNRELHEKSETTTRLVKLGELLQACVTFPEAFSVVGTAMAEFLGGLSGTVHLTSASRNLVEEMAHWGDVRSSATQFAPEDCWALRRGQEHVAGPGMLTPRCAHITENGKKGYVCMPLAAQGETLGILHLCEPNAAEKPQWLAERQQILRGVVDTLALALANLRLRETLRQQSIRDPNTSLFNRRYLEETSSRELRRMERSGQPLVVIMLDVDHFKQFNDTFGHEAGDLVLKQVAATLIEHARDSDVVSRYGGEEFALVMPGSSVQEGAERAEALRQAIRKLHLTHRGRTLGTVTASFGVAAYPEHGVGWAELTNAADHALYEAKGNGRDRVAIALGNASGERPPIQLVPAPKSS